MRKKEKMIDGNYELVDEKIKNSFDTNRVILLVLAIDCSDSMMNILPKMPSYLEQFMNHIKEDSQLYDELELLLVQYGSDYEIGDFTPARLFNVPQSFKTRGCTNTAEALLAVHKKVSERVHFYHSEVLRELPTPIIFHFSDGVKTSPEEMMRKMVETYDKTTRSDGSRRFKIWSATPYEEVEMEMKKYSDETFKLSNMKAISDVFRTIATVASSLSHSKAITNPVTGETTFEVEEGVVIPETIERISPRALTDMIN